MRTNFKTLRLRGLRNGTDPIRISVATKAYGVSRSTLRRRLKGVRPAGKGPLRYFPRDVERAIKNGSN